MQGFNNSQMILIVEDNDDDFEAAEAALRETRNFRNPITRCATGQEALDYLQATGKFAGRDDLEKPGLILLDLNLPGLDGRDVLRKIKADHSLRLIPVVVMTSSADQRDIDRCYEAGANTYIVKPLDWDGFLAAVARLKEYWLEIALLPKVLK